MRSTFAPGRWAVLLALLPALPAAAQTPSTAAAVVNGEQILLDEVDAVLSQRGPVGVVMSADHRRQMRLEALGGLIDETLVRQYLRRVTPAVSTAEVEKSVADLTAALQKMTPPKTLPQYLAESGLTPERLRANVSDVLQLQKFSAAACSEDRLRAYHAGNREFFDKVTVRASHIVLRVSPSATPAEREAARQKLEALRAQIVAGQVDFADAARQHSQCPSGPKGGDIGAFTSKGTSLDEAFVRAAFSLKPEEVSGVVATDFGLHLIKVATRTAGTPTPYESCQMEVRETYVQEAIQGLLPELRRQSKMQIQLP